MIVMDDYTTTEEVAKKLHLHVDTVKRMLREGELPGYKIRNQWRIKVSDLEQYLAERKHKTKPEQES